MSTPENLTPQFRDTLDRYQENEQHPYADTVLFTMDGEDVNFIVESDQDTLYFRVGVPCAAFDDHTPQNLRQVKHLGGATIDLEQAIRTTFLRNVSLNLTHQKTNSTWVIYGDSIPLVVDETEQYP